MKLPEKLTEFIHGPCMQFMGVRDAALQPDWSFVFGSRVNADRESVTFFVLQSHSKWILENLEHNGQVALTYSSLSAESYQIKGDYTSSRPSDEHDYAIQAIFWDKLMSEFAPLDPGGQILARFNMMLRRPTVAITFKVREAFNQTPGPGSGKLLDINE